MNTSLVSLNECARLLQLHPMSLWRWVNTLSIPHARISNVIALQPAQVQVILTTMLV
jgi:hypothetical protein